MNYNICFSETAKGDFAMLEQVNKKKIVGYVQSQMSQDPINCGSPFSDKLKNVYRYSKVGCKLYCYLDEEKKEVIVLKINKCGE